MGLCQNRYKAACRSMLQSCGLLAIGALISPAQRGLHPWFGESDLFGTMQLAHPGPAGPNLFPHIFARAARRPLGSRRNNNPRA